MFCAAVQAEILLRSGCAAWVVRRAVVRRGTVAGSLAIAVEREVKRGCEAA